MADDVELDAGAGGARIAVDGVNESGTVRRYQLMQLVTGAFNGAKTLVDGVNGLPVSVLGTVPVSIAGAIAVTGTFWQATQPVSIAATVAVSGPLTDAQLRASAVPVSGPVTDAELRATPLPVSGTVAVAGVVEVANDSGNPLPVSGAVTATQAGAWSVGVTGSVAVTGPLTDTQLRASAVPVSGTFWQATQPVSASALPLPAGASTLAEQQSQTTHLNTLQGVVTSSRAAVNPIAGQAGVAAGAGTIGVNTQRVTVASNDPVVTSLSAVAASTGVMDDWDDTDRCKVSPIAGQAGVTGGAGASDAATQRVAIASDANAVDTELPAAAALADGAANPTAPAVGSHGAVWNGSTWDREVGPQEGTLLASAARTATSASATQTNRGHRGVIVWLNVTSALAAGTALVQIEGQDPVSGNWVILNQTPQGAGAGFTGTLGLELSPGASGGTNSSAGYMIQRISGTLPRAWRVNVVHSGANSITYSVGYSLMR